MLVTRRAGHLRLVTQPQHAALAARLGEAWGNERFILPAARDSLMTAARHHDDGWYELDPRPAFTARRRRPAHFTELPLSRTVGPYTRGVESVYERDPVAGALVSMHHSGFFTGRWGLVPASPTEDPVAARVIETHEARWTKTLRQAWGGRGPRAEFDADVWHAYEVLQALDLLSLGLCLWEPDAGEALSVASTLTAIEQPPGARLVEAVPTRPRERVTIMLRRAADGVEISPWPFAGEGLATFVSVRSLEDRPYETPEEAAAAFQAAPEVSRPVLLSAPAAG